MTERDSDIEFDFFDDAEPREPLPPERPRLRGRPPRRPARGPGGLTPLLRLGGLIALAILIIVVIVVAANGCGARKQSKYDKYLGNQVDPIAKDSERLGRQLNGLLTTPGTKITEIGVSIDGLAQKQQLDVTQALTLKPPGPLRDAQQQLVEALQFRVSGLRGLAAAFRQTAGSKDVAGASILLAAQAERLLASDVVWDDLFKAPAEEELKRQGITGVAVPGSKFVSNPDYATPRAWVPIFQRLSGAATGGTPTGLHGTGLVSVRALPSDKQLDPKAQNTVVATTDLGFAVAVEDTGQAQEVGIKVTLTIQQQPTAIVKTQTIDVINPGEQKTVVFRNLQSKTPVQFATKTTVKVDIQPVPGEKNKANNSASYPVIFSLG